MTTPCQSISFFSLMSKKARIIGSIWAVTGTGALAYTSLNLQNFENKHLYLGDKIVQEALKSDAVVNFVGENASLPWYRRRGRVDDRAGRAHCRLTVVGDKGTSDLLVSAKRIRLSENDEERGWTYYWSRPWELKDVFRKKMIPYDDTWQVETAFLMANQDSAMPIVLHGDPRAHPGFARCTERAEVKSQRSYDRLKVIGGAAVGLTLVAGCVRSLKVLIMRKSYGFAKTYVIQHDTVHKVLGRPVRLLQTSGTFKPTFIDAEIAVRGKTGLSGTVFFSATRRQTQDEWRLARVLLKTTDGGEYNIRR